MGPKESEEQIRQHHRARAHIGNVKALPEAANASQVQSYSFLVHLFLMATDFSWLHSKSYPALARHWSLPGGVHRLAEQILRIRARQRTELAHQRRWSKASDPLYA